MNAKFPLAAGLLAAALLVLPFQVRAQEDKSAAKPATPEKPAEAAPPADVTTQGTVTARGQQIAYTAVAGIITVGATDDQDGQLGMDGKPLPGSQLALNPPKDPGDTPPVAVCSSFMFSIHSSLCKCSGQLPAAHDDNDLGLISWGSRRR